MEAIQQTGRVKHAWQWLRVPASMVLVFLVVLLLLTRFPLPIAITLGVAAIGAGITMAWPPAGLLLFLGLLFVRPEDFFPELWGLRVAMVMATTTFLVWGIRSVSARRWPAWSPTLTWGVAFAAAAVASMLPLPPALIQERASEMIKFVVILVLVTQLVRTTRELNIVCATLVLLTAWLAVISLVNYYTGQGFLSPQGFRARGNGTFADPNDTALALVPALPLALLGLQRGRNALVRLATALCIGLILWAIYLTNSRGGMLALAASLAVLAVMRFGWKGAVAGAVLAAAMLAFGPSRLAEIGATDDSAAGRLEVWDLGLRLLASRPILGVGMGQFTEYHETALTAHNSFVLALAETGLIGAVCWVGLFVSTMRRGHIAREEGGGGPEAARWRAINRAAAASLIGYLAAAMFLSKTYFEIPFIYLGIGAAASSRLLQARRPAETGRGSARPEIGLALLFTVLGIAAVAAVVRVAR